MQRNAAHCADFARYARNAHAIATIGRQIDFENRVVQSECAGDVFTRPQFGRQIHQPRAFLAERQLARGTQHAAGLDTAKLGLLDLDAARKLRTDQRERRLHTGAHVRCAADDLQLLMAVRDAAHVELLRIGMLLDRQHLTDDNAFEIGTGTMNTFDLEPGHRQSMGQRRHVIAGVYPITQPLQTDFHVCTRLLKRTASGSADRSRNTDEYR